MRLLNILIALVICSSLSGCMTLSNSTIEFPKFGLYSASPPPMANEGEGWLDNTSHSEWVSRTSPSGILDNPASGPYPR